MTDAVVAALAEVEKSQSEVRVPAEAKAEAPARADATVKVGGVGEPAPAKQDAKAPADPPPEDRTIPDTEAPRAEGASADATIKTTALDAGKVDAAKGDAATGDAAKASDPKNDVSTEPPPADRSSPTLETKIESGGSPDEKPTEKYATQPAADAKPKTTPPGIAVDYFGRTDVGLVREHNEDNFLVVDLEAQKRGVGAAILHTKIEGAGALFAVCDGMGGAAAGEVASQMAVDTIHEMMQNGGAPRDRDHFARRLVRAIEEAGSRIFAAAKMDRSRRGMGTTSTVAGLVDKTLFVGQVGDSRAYVLRHLPDGTDQFGLITKDQSLVNQLIEAGQLTEEEAEAFEHSNIILQALGTTEEVTVDLTFLELRRGDRLLMCSDGLSGLVHGDMIKEVLKTSRDLIECANQLIAMANAGGGHDNITVVLAEFDGESLAAASASDRVAYQQYPLPPEDPKDPDPAPRSTTIKSGGPKPGSDVKHESATLASVRPGEPGGNRTLLIGVLLVVLVLVGIAIMLFNSGEASSSAPPTTRTTVSHGAGSAHAPTTNLHVLSSIDDATLYVDGVSRGALMDDMHVTVEPGTHHLEARIGASVIAQQDVTAAAGTGSMVSLIPDEAPLPPTDIAPPSGPAVPSGADMPEDDLPATSGTP